MMFPAPKELSLMFWAVISLVVLAGCLIGAVLTWMVTK